MRPPEQLPAPAAPPRPPLPPVSTQPEVPVARVPRIQEDLRLLAGVPLRRTQPPAVGFQPVRPAAQPTQELPPQPPSPSEISLVQRIQQLVEQQLIDLHAIAPAIVPEAPCQPLTAPPAEAQPLVPTPAAQPPPETLPSGLELAVQQLQYVQQFRAAIEAQIALAQQVPHQPPPPQVAPALVVPEGPPPGGPAGAPWLAALPAWVGATLPQPAAPIFPEGAAPAPLIGHLYPFQPTTPLESAVLRSSPARPAAARLPVWPALQPPSLPHMGAPPVQRPVPPTGAPPSVQPLITPGPLHADFDFEAFLACPQDFLTDQQAQLLQALLARSPTGRTQPAAAPTAPLPAPVPHVGAVVSEAGVQLEGAVQASGPAPAQLLLPFAGVPLSGPEAQSQGHVVEEERHTEEIQDESGETGSNDGGEGQVT